jgi:hypothetical protein
MTAKEQMARQTARDELAATEAIQALQVGQLEVSNVRIRT